MKVYSFHVFGREYGFRVVNEDWKENIYWGYSRRILYMGRFDIFLGCKRFE